MVVWPILKKGCRRVKARDGQSKPCARDLSALVRYHVPMPTIDNHGVNIHYETIGQGPPLLCVHGLWSSGRAYHDGGWVAALRDDYRLLLPDVRGHGRSAKPHDTAAYTPDELASDVLAVLDAEGVARAHVLGYSMGGWVAHALARLAPERTLSLMVGGAGVDPQQTHNAVAMRFMLRVLDQQGLEALIRSITLPNLSDEVRLNLLSNDPLALRALVAAWLEHATGAIDHLRRFERPALMFAGDRDPYAAAAKECAAALPQGRFVLLPGHTHDSAMLDGADAIAAVRAFLCGVA